MFRVFEVICRIPGNNSTRPGHPWIRRLFHKVPAVSTVSQLLKFITHQLFSPSTCIYLHKPQHRQHFRTPTTSEMDTPSQNPTEMINRKPFPCGGCIKSFKTTKLRAEHCKVVGHKKTPAFKPINCRACKRAFSSANDLDQHRDATGHGKERILQGAATPGIAETKAKSSSPPEIHDSTLPVESSTTNDPEPQTVFEWRPWVACWNCRTCFWLSILLAVVYTHRLYYYLARDASLL